MSLYRADSGALVFGAGTVQWSWGLDGTHDRGGSTEDPRMQQATVNLFSDMGVQPSTLQSGLTAGGALDTVAPTATITSPTGGSTVPGGNITILGTAADTGGIVAAVEISIDGGTTWSRATGTTSWSYTISSSNASMTVQARAIADAANIGTPMTRNFTAAAQTCPCSIFAPAVTGVQENDAAAVELGVKFRSDISGFITGIRFYKTAGNTGTHTGRLWSAGGANLGAVRLRVKPAAVGKKRSSALRSRSTRRRPTSRHIIRLPATMPSGRHLPPPGLITLRCTLCRVESTAQTASTYMVLAAYFRQRRSDRPTIWWMLYLTALSAPILRRHR
ncbi:MAG: DUF4082 domain-containing protein [Chloracidobacterium sp.]|nr:DUF4082 domain-containing protein [Chloracidobacterium sp.]